MVAEKIILNSQDIRRISSRVGRNPLVRLNTSFHKVNVHRFGITRKGKYYVVECIGRKEVIFYQIFEFDEEALKRISGAALPV